MFVIGQLRSKRLRFPNRSAFPCRLRRRRNSGSKAGGRRSPGIGRDACNRREALTWHGEPFAVASCLTPIRRREGARHLRRAVRRVPRMELDAEGITSLNRARWTPKQAFEATVRHAEDLRVDASCFYSPEAERFWAKKEHHVPDPDCTCGMYAEITCSI